MLSISRSNVPKLFRVSACANHFQSKRNVDIYRISPPEGNPHLRLGDYPKTQEQREMAAKKYCLIPEDYEPYEEGLALGDYPKLKAIGAYNRDPYDDFDDPIDLRFYGEVFHRDADLYQWERINPLADEKGNPSAWVKAAIVIGTIAFIPALGFFMHHYQLNINHPWKNRHPFPDRVLYEFPQSESSHH